MNAITHESDRDCAPRIFLPGWGFGVGPLRATLAKTNWRLMSLPGSEGEAEIPASFVEARDSILERLPEVCHLGGWSLGGILALACAIVAPRRILSLFLVGATPSFICREGWEKARPPGELKAFMSKIKQEGAAILPRFIGSFCRGDCVPNAAECLWRDTSPMPQSALDAGLVWLSEADLRPDIDKISCPVTLVHGENDPVIPLEASVWMAARMKNARLAVLPGRAHAPFAGDNAGDNAEFLRECARS